jgi:hypothetical protein
LQACYLWLALCTYNHIASYTAWCGQISPCSTLCVLAVCIMMSACFLLVSTCRSIGTQNVICLKLGWHISPCDVRRDVISRDCSFPCFPICARASCVCVCVCLPSRKVIQPETLPFRSSFLHVTFLVRVLLMYSHTRTHEHSNAT